MNSRVTSPHVVRKRRGKSTLGREHEWEYLMGEAPTRWNPEQGLMKESSQNVGACGGMC